MRKHYQIWFIPTYLGMHLAKTHVDYMLAYDYEGRYEVTRPGEEPVLEPSDWPEKVSPFKITRKKAEEFLGRAKVIKLLGDYSSNKLILNK